MVLSPAGFSVHLNPHYHFSAVQIPSSMQVMVFACETHIFHSVCIRQWLMHQNTCPLCRHQLPVQEEEVPADIDEDLMWLEESFEVPILLALRFTPLSMDLHGTCLLQKQTKFCKG